MPTSDLGKSNAVALYGTVRHFDPLSGFGRIDTPVGRHVRFHRSSVQGGIDALHAGCHVCLDLAEGGGEDGPFAGAVRLLTVHPGVLGNPLTHVERCPEI